MEDEIYRVAPDRPNFRVTSGRKITITKISSNNSVDFMLYPSLTLVVKSNNGQNIDFIRSIASYITPYTRNPRVLEINETFDVKDGLLIEISNQKRNVDYNLSIFYRLI